MHIAFEPLEGRALLATVAPPPGVSAPAVVRAAAPAVIPKVVAIPNVVYTTQGGRQQHMDILKPAGTPPPGGWPTVLAIPGGGWRWVRRSDLARRAMVLAEHGYVVAVADYTFAADGPPSKSWPNNLDDLRAAVRWLRANSARLGVDPSRIAALGESAGAHLAELLGTSADDTSPATTNFSGPRRALMPNANVSARVQAVIAFYGASDLPRIYQDAPRDRSFLMTFLGNGPAQVPSLYAAASPVDQVKRGDPPFLLLHGTADTSVPYTQSVEMADRLTKAGVPNRLILIPGERHGFSFTGGYRDNLPDVLAFLDAAFAGKPIPKG